MFFSKENRLNTLLGVSFISVFALFSQWISERQAVKALGFSPLTIAIVMGMLIGNFSYQKIPVHWHIGIKFSMQKLLRLGIILYGFRITFQQIYDIGLAAVFIDIFIVASTFIIGTLVGTRFLGLDRDSAMLTASGASICGAAAVLATEPVLKSESHKTAIAVATVVLFGTIAMFTDPLIYQLGLLTDQQFGIYTGATVHEVAQVVAVGTAINQQVLDVAVIVKLTRVFLLVPFLLSLSFYLYQGAKKESSSSQQIVIPWFAFMFLLVSGIHSLGIVPASLIPSVVRFDTFLLTMAMLAVGIETNISRFKNVGLKPIYLAGFLMIWLNIVGYYLSKFFA